MTNEELTTPELARRTVALTIAINALKRNWSRNAQEMITLRKMRDEIREQLDHLEKTK